MQESQHLVLEPNMNCDQNLKQSIRMKKMACVECRQQKSKCDAQELYPNPCTRCSKKKIRCSLQADYKRTYKRAKFQQVEEELEELKKNLSEAGIDNLLQQLKQKKFQPYELNKARCCSSPQDSTSNVSNSIRNIPSIPINHQISSSSSQVPSQLPSRTGTPQSYHQPHIVPRLDMGPSIIRDQTPPINTPDDKESTIELTEKILFCTPKQFGEVKLSSQQIRELFIEFVHKYHRFLPIIDISKGPERIHSLCPVLFWTIISVSLRHLSTNTLMTLAPLLKTALAEITITPITRYIPNEEEEPILNVSSVYSVQALLLYTFWPPLTSSLSADSSWNTIGIAIFQAIRLGLNGPSTNNYTLQQQLNASSIIKENIITWVSCNIVSQTIATAFGFPSFVSFDNSVVECTRNGSTTTVPKSIQHMIQIAHFEDQIAKVLNSNNIDSMGLVDPVERLPLLKVLAQQLNEVELKLKNEGLDDIRKFQIYSTRVHLLTYYFLDNSRLAPFELRRGLVSLYNAALKLLTHSSTVSKKDPFFIKYSPAVFILKIWQASCIVAKLTHSELSDVIDIGAGRQLYSVGIQLTMKASVLKHDMAYRSSGIMRNMWQLFKTLRDRTDISNLNVTINSRMSASVFFDCLWVLREQVGMIKLDPNQRQRNDNSKNECDNDNDDDDGDDDDDDDDDDDVDDGVDDDVDDDDVDDDDDDVDDVDDVDDDDVDDDNDNDNDNDNDDKEKEKEVFVSNENGKPVEPGTITPENSDLKSISSTALKKKPRSLSNTFNAENSARRIIRTIPLDPEPISIKNGDNRIPLNRSKTSSLKDIINSTPPEISINQDNKGQHNLPILQQLQEPNNGHDVSPTNVLSLDASDDWTSDMLWKDVDSVMNDFGFNIDDLVQNTASVVNPTLEQQQPSLFPYSTRKF